MGRKAAAIGSFLRRNSLTILTLTISVLTLFVYVRQTNLLSEQTEALIRQNKASFWPHLTIGAGMSARESKEGVVFDEYNISVMNQGVGPAIIEKVVVKVKEKEYSSWKELFDDYLPDTIAREYRQGILSKNVFLPGKYEQIINFQHNLEIVNLLHSKNVLQNLEIIVCYKSIYDEYWTVTINDISHYTKTQIEWVKSDACLLEAKTYFAD